MQALGYTCSAQHTPHVGPAAQGGTAQDDPATPEALSHDARPPANIYHLPEVVRRPSGVDGLSREGWIDKLNDERCKWMVMLHRYSSSRSSGSSSSNNPLSKLRQDDTRKTSASKSRVPGRRVVPAVDFCPECASIVEVELECAGEGEFVAEYRRACSMCVSEQQPWLRSTNKIETPNPWRIQANTNRHCGVDQSWPIGKKVKARLMFCFKNNAGRSLCPDAGHKLVVPGTY